MDEDHATGARTIAGEADNQPELGQRAIAHVMVNRGRTRRWGASLYSVCMWPHQFSCWRNDADCERIIKIPQADARLQRYAEFIEDAEQGEPDMTNGALYYKVSTLPWPKDWGPEVPPTFSAGAHSFYILQEGESHEQHQPNAGV